MIFSIKLPAGSSIDDALKLLKDTAVGYNCSAVEEPRTVVCANFNDAFITSEMTIDEAYLAVCKMTKAEYNKKVKDEYEAALKARINYEKKLNDIYDTYKLVARSYLEPECYKDFVKDLYIYLNSGYGTYVIDSFFELIPITKQNKPLEDIISECKAQSYKQGHSGNTASQMFRLVRKYCINGEEIANTIFGY